MQCKKCGSFLNEDATFCPNCGSLVEQSETTSQNNVNGGVNQAPDLMTGMNTQPQSETMAANDQTQNLNSENNTQVTNSVNPTPNKKNNKKVFIIGGIVAVVLVVAIVCFFIFKNSGTVTNLVGVNVWIPNDFTEESRYGYEKLYASKDKDVIVGLITQNAYSATLDQYMDAIDSGEMMGSIKCEKSTKQTIKGQEWGHVTCSTSTQESNMYITVKNSKLYMVEVAAQNDSANKIDSIDSKIKQNLEIVK